MCTIRTATRRGPSNSARPESSARQACSSRAPATSSWPPAATNSIRTGARRTQRRIEPRRTRRARRYRSWFTNVFVVSMSTLVASHLTRRFDARVAVDDVSFELAPGAIFALLGPNGAGKTATLRMLTGLIDPSGGSVSIDGERMSRTAGPRLRGHIGFLTEAPGLWDRLTVRANLLVYARLHGITNPERAVDEALDLFDITNRQHDRAAQLSKGLKQRVALARTLLHEPEIVLLDEP